jgi:hypothetical protein
MEKDEIQAYVRTFKRMFAQHNGIPGFDNNGDFAGFRDTDNTKSLAEAVKPLDLKELLRHYAIIRWAASRERAYPAAQMGNIKKELKILLKDGWLQSQSDVFGITDHIMRHMMKTYKGDMIFIQTGKGKKRLWPKFPSDFLTFILSQHITRPGKYKMIADFLNEQLSNEVDVESVKKRFYRLRVNRLWMGYEVVMSELQYTLCRYASGMSELSDVDKPLIYEQVFRPFTYFLPFSLKERLGIDDTIGTKQA